MNQQRSKTAGIRLNFSPYHLHFISPVLAIYFLLYIVYVLAIQSIYSVYVLLVIPKILSKILHPKHYKSHIHIFQPMLQSFPHIKKNCNRSQTSSLCTKNGDFWSTELFGSPLLSLGWILSTMS